LKRSVLDIKVAYSAVSYIVAFGCHILHFFIVKLFVFRTC